MSPRSILLALVVVLMWGGNFIAVKYAARDFPPVFLVALRFCLVAALMLPFVRRPKPRELPAIIAVSITLGALHFGLSFAGIARIEASTAAIASQLGAPFSTLLAVVLFRDTVGLRRLLGIVVAFAGVVMLAGAPDIASDGLGLAMVVGSALAWAIANTIIKHYGPFNSYMLTAWMALLAVPQLLLVSFQTEAGQLQSLTSADWLSWGALLYTALGSTIIAYSFWYTLINTNPVSRIVPFTLLAPVFAVLLSVPLLGERLTLPLIVGGATTIFGVALCEVNFKRMFAERRRPVTGEVPQQD